jgi:hypothetical protein
MYAVVDTINDEIMKNKECKYFWKLMVDVLFEMHKVNPELASKKLAKAMGNVLHITNPIKSYIFI